MNGSTQQLRRARRGTSREVNRRILLTLIAAHQPVSRADLARLMDTNRASITLIVNQMIESGVISEGAVGQIARGVSRGSCISMLGRAACRRRHPSTNTI